jgi:hypothetical protein
LPAKVPEARPSAQHRSSGPQRVSQRLSSQQGQQHMFDGDMRANSSINLWAGHGGVAPADAAAQRPSQQQRSSQQVPKARQSMRSFDGDMRANSTIDDWAGHGGQSPNGARAAAPTDATTPQPGWPQQDSERAAQMARVRQSMKSFDGDMRANSTIDDWNGHVAPSHAPRAKFAPPPPPWKREADLASSADMFVSRKSMQSVPELDGHFLSESEPSDRYHSHAPRLRPSMHGFDADT